MGGAFDTGQLRRAYMTLFMEYLQREQKGREEGWKERGEAIARKLLQEQVPVDLILRTTGISEERMLELKRELPALP